MLHVFEFGLLDFLVHSDLVLPLLLLAAAAAFSCGVKMNIFPCHVPIAGGVLLLLGVLPLMFHCSNKISVYLLLLVLGG